jgi:phosphate starvation-inducible PhoH-like protein
MARNKSTTNSKASSSKIEPLAPASENQALAMQYFKEKSVTILEGLAGTGKTYIAVHYALQQFFSNKVSKIIFTRPLVNVGNEQLGYLPGDVNDKTRPYTEQFAEYMEEFMPMMQFSDEKKIQSGLEFIPLAYIRGRNFQNTIIIADEMQNSTQLQMKTLLTRLAEQSKLIILGDTKQADRIDRVKNGLVDFVERHTAYNHPDIGLVTFKEEDIRRSEIIRHIMKMYGDI